MNDNLLGFLKSRPRAVGEAFRTNPRHQSRRRVGVLEARTRGEDKLRHACSTSVGWVRALTSSTPPPTAAFIRIRTRRVNSHPLDRGGRGRHRADRRDLPGPDQIPRALPDGDDQVGRPRLSRPKRKAVRSAEAEQS